MTIKRYFITLSLAYIALFTALGIHGCMGLDQALGIQAETDVAQTEFDIINEEMRGLRADLLKVKADEPDAAATVDGLIAAFEKESAKAAKLLEVIKANAKKLAEADEAWDLTQSLISVAAGFFPPLAVAVPMIQRGRRMFNGVVGAMAAGGGPVNGQLANEFMGNVKGLKRAVTMQRVEIGDKVMEAVKVNNT